MTSDLGHKEIDKMTGELVMCQYMVIEWSLYWKTLPSGKLV